MPLLFLEGDCTLRSIGQQNTRIEAFVEMLDAGTWRIHYDKEVIVDNYYCIR